MEDNNKQLETQGENKESILSAEKLKLQNDLLEAEINRAEQLRNRSIMGGTSASTNQPEQKDETMIKKDKAMEFWKGTGIEESIRKHG
jgi:hypothetical protein